MRRDWRKCMYFFFLNELLFWKTWICKPIYTLLFLVLSKYWRISLSPNMNNSQLKIQFAFLYENYILCWWVFMVLAIFLTACCSVYISDTVSILSSRIIRNSSQNFSKAIQWPQSGNASYFTDLIKRVKMSKHNL